MKSMLPWVRRGSGPLWEKINNQSEWLFPNANWTERLLHTAEKPKFTVKKDMDWNSCFKSISLNASEKRILQLQFNCNSTEMIRDRTRSLYGFPQAFFKSKETPAAGWRYKKEKHSAGLDVSKLHLVQGRPSPLHPPSPCSPQCTRPRQDNRGQLQLHLAPPPLSHGQN